MTVKQKAGELDLTITMITKGTAAFAVIYSDLPEDTLKSQKPTEILTTGEKGFVDNFKAKVTDSRNLEFGKDKFPARQIAAEKSTGEKDTVQLRIIIIMADKRLYQAFVVGPKEVVEGKDTDAFFKSLEISK
jgi:hypothetical protein